MAVAAALLFIVAFLLLGLHSAEAQIGVCYGRKGDNLPCAEDVVNLYEYYGIGAMRLYEPDEATLEALQGTNIQLMLGVSNQDIPCIASDQSNADDWVENNVLPYATTIKYIAVGNEIHPTDSEASSVEPAMQNILNALISNDLGSQIMVSTAVDTTLITNSFPPSHAEFINLTYVTPIINFLTTNESPLLVNIQPYIAYVNDPQHIALDYALFRAKKPVVNDTYNGVTLCYYNLFDAIYDAVYIAIQKVVTSQEQHSNSLYDDNKRQTKKTKPPTTSESGWSSKDGFHRHNLKNNAWRMSDQLHETKKLDPRSSQTEEVDVATPENAKTYYTNLINHVKQGTPLTAGQPMETYLFAMFDENQKPGNESERHFGLFTPDQQPKYGQLSF